MVINRRGFTPVVLLVTIIWLTMAICGVTFIYRQLHHAKPYAAPADSSKLPPRP
jgi:hypothetical protein